MLRLLPTHGFVGLLRCSYLTPSCVAKRSVTHFLLASSACHHRRPIITRHFNTGSPLWKDELQPTREKSEEMQTVDLDKWKSVMRAQAAPGKKQADEEEASDDDENLKDAGDGEKGIYSPDATRDLVAMWRKAGKLVPEEMTDEEVGALAELTTKSSRKKYLKFLAVKEGLKRARKEKQQRKATEREAAMEKKRQDMEAEEEGEPKLKNTFLLKYWSRSSDKLLAWRSAQAMMFGQPLVFDMSYESSMARRELENTVSQLLDVEGWNRRAADPFHLHFCSLQPDGAYKKELLKRYGAEVWDRLLITTTERQHVDVFPREKLVYLTADSPNVLRTFDHSKVYIIGALVDRSIQSGLSLANAKRLKLATARLPLDEFLHWEIGGKNLTLDQMIRIMITVKETGKWEEAFKFVPKRKHDGFHQQRTWKENTNDRVKVDHGPRHADGRGFKSDDGTFTNAHRSLHGFHKQSGFTVRKRMSGLPSDKENKPAAERVQTSCKKSLEGRRGAGKSKMWWDE